MNQDERYDETTYDQSYDFNQGYDVPAYEEQPYAEADPHQVYAEEQPAFAPESAPAAPGPAERRVPQAEPQGEIYESAYDEDEEYVDDDEEYVDDDEDFPEPAKKVKGEGKKGTSPVVLAVGALGAVGLVGTMFFLDPLELGLSEYTAPIMAMLPGAAPEEAPIDAPMADSAEWQAPVERERAPEPPPEEAEAPPAAEAPPVAKPKPKPAEVAAEPEAPPAQPAAAKPKAKPPAPAAKPKPKPVAAAKPPAARPAAVPQIKTAVAFAPNSAWVAAAEVEKLWAFSSRIQGSGGHLTIEGYAGYEQDAYALSRRRADYVAQMLKKNNVGTDYTITVKAMGQQPGGGPRVNITYSSKL